MSLRTLWTELCICEGTDSLSDSSSAPGGGTVYMKTNFKYGQVQKSLLSMQTIRFNAIKFNTIFLYKLFTLTDLDINCTL
jgi:hypothetical protein